MLTKETFALIYPRYFRLVRKIFERRNFEEGLLDDLAQDFFVDLLERPETWADSVDSLKSYVAKRARNFSLDQQRRACAQKRKPETWEMDWDLEPVPDVEDISVEEPEQLNALIAKELRTALKEIVSRLPAEHREVNEARLETEDDESVSVRFGRRRVGDATRALRREAGIPPRNPAAVGAVDQSEFLILAARRLAEERASPASALMRTARDLTERHEETPCDRDSSPSNDNAPPIPTAPRESGATSKSAKRPTPTVGMRGLVRKSGGTPSLSGSVKTPSSRSPQPASACERSLRPAPNAPASGASATKTSSSDAPRSGPSSPSIEDLASAPTLIRPVLSKRADETTSTDAPPLLMDDEPSFSGSDL